MAHQLLATFAINLYLSLARMPHHVYLPPITLAPLASLDSCKDVFFYGIRIPPESSAAGEQHHPLPGTRPQSTPATRQRTSSSPPPSASASTSAPTPTQTQTQIPSGSDRRRSKRLRASSKSRSLTSKRLTRRGAAQNITDRHSVCTRCSSFDSARNQRDIQPPLVAQHHSLLLQSLRTIGRITVEPPSMDRAAIQDRAAVRCPLARGQRRTNTVHESEGDRGQRAAAR